MRLFKMVSVMVLAVIFIINFAVCSFAEEKNTGVKVLGKFKRGIMNLVTGLFEVPKNIINTTKESNLFVGLTLGSAKGVGMAVVRTGAGIYETLTFPVPVPANYEPILEPEAVFKKEESVTTPTTSQSTPAQSQAQPAQEHPAQAQPAK